MGVYEEVATEQPGMHWQQQDRYVGSAYDPSRDLSPNLPVHSCDSSSMGDVDPSLSTNSSLCSTTSGSNCSTPSNSNNNITTSNNSNACSVHPCSHHRGYDVTPHMRPMAPCNNNCGGDSHCPRRSYDRTAPSSFPDCESNAFHSPLVHPKIEPNSSAPSSPQASAGEAVVCDGCGLKIRDRFIFQAVDRRWHAACLQCCQCRQALESQATCFTRDGNIYCKKDYYRLFGVKRRCARCQAAILATDFVMRARELVFHVHCFACAVCNSVLTKGDHFGMKDGAVFCRVHYELALSESRSAEEPNPASSSTTTFPTAGYQPPYPSPEFHHHHHHMSPPISLQHGSPATIPDVIANTKVSFFNGVASGTTRQKGRPRKRKAKDLESMTASLDLNADYLDVPFGRGPGTPGMPGSNGQQRTKRMRTSFKHHQLRTMKSYFALNHNPDAKDLKQLSQKTGLPKRVLQVWFQNARAKWRRMVLKQEGKSGQGDGKCSGPDSVGSLGDLDSYQHGPGGSLSGDYHSQSLGPHSPPFILSSSPPSSLEC